MNRRRLIIGSVIVAIILGAVYAVGQPDDESAVVETAPTPTEVAEPTEAPMASPAPTATAEVLSAADHLKSLVVCGRVTVLASMYWGQAPGLAYSGNPQVSGQLQQGDVIQFLTSEPNANGEVRVKVFPQDGRAVGKTNNQVWISWATVSQNRLDLFAFKCES